MTSGRYKVMALVLGSIAFLAACGRGIQPQPPGSLATPVAPSPTVVPLPTLDTAEVARGRQIYLQHCASCHGPDAEGAPNWEQPDERGNLPPPPHDDSGHTWRHGDEELYHIIRDGWRDPFNQTPELTMPPFKDTLSEAEIRAVITYFKSLWSEEHRRWQWEETQAQP